MPESNPPSFLQNVSTEQAQQARKLIEGLVSTPGVGSAADLAVTQNGTPNMTVNVAAGAAFIRGGTSPLIQGTYHVFSDSVVNLPLAASNATNPRIDMVVAKVEDAFYAGAVNAWSLAVVTGTPAATPVAPAVPTSSVALAQIAVGASVASVDNSKITDLRVRAEALRAPAPPVPDHPAAADLTALTTTPVDVPGATYTWTPPVAWTGLVVAVFEFFVTTAGPTATGSVVVNGVASPRVALLYAPNQILATVSTIVPVTLPAGTPATIKLQAYRNTTAGAAQMLAAGTSFNLLRA